MKKTDIRVGGRYTANVSGNLTTVRVDQIVETPAVRNEFSGRAVRKAGTIYQCTNLATGRGVQIKSAAKFLKEVPAGACIPLETAKASQGLNAMSPVSLPNRGAAGAFRRRANVVRPTTAEVFVSLPTNEARAEYERREAANPTPPNITAFCQGDEPDCCEGDLDGDGKCDACGKLLKPNGPTCQKCGKQWDGLDAHRSENLCDACYFGKKPAPAPVTPLAAKLAAAASVPKNTDTAPHLIVEARAGTGKTTTLVCGLQSLRGVKPHVIVEGPQGSFRMDIEPSDQQAKVWDSICLSRGKANTVAFVAFNKSIATELQRRVPSGCDAMTMHSMGFKAVCKNWKLKPGRDAVSDYVIPDFVAELMEEDVRGLRRNRPVLLRGTERLAQLCKMNMIGIEGPGLLHDPADLDWWAEQLTELTEHYDLDLEDEGPDVFTLVPQVLDLCLDPSRNGRVEYADMIWLPVAHGLSVYRYDMLLVDEAQDLNRCQQALAKMAGRRLILCGDPCQPAGTEIHLADGRVVGIEDLVEGDRVVSYAGPRSGDFCVGTVRGITKRSYNGPLVVVRAGDLTSRYTPNHHCYANFSPLRNKFCVYLMKRGSNYRVGRSKVGHTGQGTGPVIRMRNEGADAVWVLSIHDSLREAHIWEQICTVKFGIPQLMFTECNLSTIGDQHALDQIWAHDTETEQRATRCLEYFGRDLRYPLFTAEQGNQRTMKRWMVVRACNLMEGCWVMPYLGRRTKPSQWVEARVSHEQYAGWVYSMTVDSPTRLYVGDGILTHNCQAIYGFAGADARSMPRMAEELAGTPNGCDLLPLTVTRRCGKAIVREAQRYVPEFEAHETNPEGLISRAPFNKDDPGCYTGKVNDGDMVLCRVNAPLVSQCFRFLKEGRKANIQGRDIGEGLVSTVKKLHATSVDDLVAKVDDWLHKETAKENAKRIPSESRLMVLQDRADCLLCFTENAKTVEEVIKKITAIFTDGRECPRCKKQGKEDQKECWECKVPLRPAGGIRLSSIHKAKGLEADRVFLLQPRGGECPHPMAKTSWQMEQEYNLLYVAITRAKHELTYVNDTAD